MPTEKVIIVESKPIEPARSYKNYGVKKRWKEAIKWNSDGPRGTINHCVEGYFREMLKLLKHHLAGTQALVIERNDRFNSDSLYDMHSFLCSTCYLHLHCDLAYTYLVDFAFDNCPIEKQLRSILDSYLMQGRTKEVLLSPDHTTFYRNSLAFQDKKHHYLL